MALTKEQYESLPDFAQSDYELHGDGYRPKAEGKVDALKGSLNDLDGKFKSTEQRLNEIEQSKAEEIERAKVEALENAKTKGEKADVIARYEEQMEDLKKRAGETNSQYENRIQELEGVIKTSKKNEVLSSLRSKLEVFEDCHGVFDRIVGSMIDVDPSTGKRVYLGEDGGATSLDDAGFLSQLDKDPAIARLRKASPTGNGGVVTGGNNAGGGASKRFNEYTGAELKDIRAKDPAKYQRLKDEFNAKED